MNVIVYDYLIYRVEYPLENGYRMECKPLPHWMHITITDHDDSKYLTVYSRIHENKEVRLNPTYSSDFTDRAIITDLCSRIHKMFID